MHGYKNRARNKRNQRPAIIPWRPIWNWLSADHRKREFLPSNNFRDNDWRTWSDQFNITLTWFSYQLAITAASLTAFFTGIGQVFLKLMRQQ